MIHITENGIDYYEGFLVRGHASYAEHGRDIVCASVSALTQAVAFEIEYRGWGFYKKMDEEGILLVVIHQEHQNKKECAVLIEMLLRSLRALESQYPENIKVEGDKHI